MLTIRIKERTSRATTGGANRYRALRLHWNIREYGACKLRFPHAKEFLQKWVGIWARVRKNVRQPFPRPKTFKECLFYTSRVGPATVLWAQVFMSQCLVQHTDRLHLHICLPLKHTLNLLSGSSPLCVITVSNIKRYRVGESKHNTLLRCKVSQGRRHVSALYYKAIIRSDIVKTKEENYNVTYCLYTVYSMLWLREGG